MSRVRSRFNLSEQVYTAKRHLPTREDEVSRPLRKATEVVVNTAEG